MQKDIENIESDNALIDKLKQLLPNCFDKDGNVIETHFNQVLQSANIETTKEYYNLNWLGKSYAKFLTREPISTFLSPDIEHNQLPQNQNSHNLLIKGDNLEVMKHLVYAYSDAIKMIYIDPPYNTGNDGFVYEDDRKFTPPELAKLAKISEEEAKRILSFTAKKSNSHNAWLTFMYPRLYIARQLLKDDGIIFISIDDNQQAQLKLLCDEIFGESNFITQFIWKSGSTGKQDKTYSIIGHEYVLCYAKNKVYDFNLFSKIKTSTSYNKSDANGEYSLVRLDSKTIQYHQSLDYPIVNNGIEYYPEQPEGRSKVARWRWSKDTVEKNFHDLVFENGYVYTKNYKKNGAKINSLLVDNEIYGVTRTGKKDFEVSFGMDSLFDYVKPIRLINAFIEITTNYNSDDIILDFFAGSGTTGDAVMQLNQSDNGNRKYILVQLSEPIKNQFANDFVINELNKSPTICEITSERLIRSTNKIKSENDDYQGDLGFKIFATKPKDYPQYNYLTNITADSKPQMFMPIDEGVITDILCSWKTYDGEHLSIDATPIILKDGYTVYRVAHRLYLLQPNFSIDCLVELINKIDNDDSFNINMIIILGFNFDSKIQREIKEAFSSYNNRKDSKIEVIVRYL
jgi:adenine-specific DNA-methyltransferase